MDDSRVLICSFCAYSTKRRYNLQRHTKVVHGHELMDGEHSGANVNVEGANVSLEGANVSLEGANVSHEGANVSLEGANVSLEGANVEQPAANVEEIKCPDCYKTFRNKKNLQQHRLICRKVSDPLACPFCAQTYSCRATKSRHMKICKARLANQVSTKTIQPTVAQTIGTQINNNNTTNNIQINNTININVNDFGKEDLSHITPQLMGQWFMQKNGVGLFNFLKHVHLNMEAPHNHNIRDHPSKKMIEVKKEGSWVVADCEDTLDKALRKYRSELIAHSNDPEFKKRLNQDEMELYNLLQHHLEFSAETTPNSFYKIMRMFCAELINFARAQTELAISDK